MHAAVIGGPGEPPVYGEFAEPPPDDSLTEVYLVAAGLHVAVRSLAEGTHYGRGQHWPLIPGIDAVARTSAGEYVYTAGVEPPFGTFAERMRVPFVIPLPPEADPVQVAACMNPGMPSWLALGRELANRSIQTVLVLGATGVAGSLAVQNARLLGIPDRRA